jgi:hypothetical protein
VKKILLLLMLLMFTTVAVAADYSEDFEGYAVGADPEGWVDTKAGNSMEQDPAIFQVFSVGNTKVFGTGVTSANIHSHYLPLFMDNFESFEFAGKMYTTSISKSGIGVTFLSKYPQSDDYYRLRNYGSEGFGIYPHPHDIRVVKGTTNSKVVPVTNTWYSFRVFVQLTDKQTNILARVWKSSDPEPSEWQIMAYDDSADRLQRGVFGVYSSGAGSQYFDDLSVKTNKVEQTVIEIPYGIIRVKIDPSPDQRVVGYNLYYKKGNDGQPVKIDIKQATETVLAEGTLDADVVYEFYATAYGNVDGKLQESAPSNSIFIKLIRINTDPLCPPSMRQVCP